MVVTDIVDIDKKRKKIYLDGEYVFALYNQEIYRYNIKTGAELDKDIYREIDCELLPKRVKSRALYILKSSLKTEKQLFDKLLEGGYAHKYAAIGVEYAKSFGYIDDLRYAEYFVENSCNGRSRRDIEQRLFQRGIDRDIIRKVLDDLRPDTQDDVEAVWVALRKKSITRENISKLDYEKRGKIFAYLMRKGFSTDIIGKVLHCDI